MENEIIDLSSRIFIWQSLCLLTLVFWIYCLIHISNSRLQQPNKGKWVLVILLLPILGALLYLMMGKNEKLKLG